MRQNNQNQNQNQSNALKQMAGSLSNALFGAGMVTSMTEQLTNIEETAKLNGLSQAIENLKQSTYYRVVAWGSANRLQQGDNSITLWNTVEDSINQAQQKDEGVKSNLDDVLTQAPYAYNAFVDRILEWEQFSEQALQNAKAALEQLQGAGAFNR